MNFIIAYFKGFWQMLRSGKMLGIHYLSLLVLALLSALPFFNLLQAKIGNSLAISKLLDGFDYTVFQDFRNMPGVDAALGSIFNTNQYLLILFAIWSVFLTGGVLEVYKRAPEKFNLRNFFSGATYYFWRLLRLTLYFLIVHLLIIAGFVAIYNLATQGGFAALGSEVGYINILRVLLPCYLLVASWFFMVQDYAKIHMVHRDKAWVFRSFWQSFGIAFGNFFNTFLLYVLNAATFVGLVAAYYILNQDLLTDTPQGVALALLLGQAFIIGRIAVRLLNLASATLLYKGIMTKRETKKNAAKAAEEARLQAIEVAEAEAKAAQAQAEAAAATAAAAALSANAAAAKADALDTPSEPILPTAENSSGPISRADGIGLQIPEIADLPTSTSIDLSKSKIEIPPVEQDATQVIPPAEEAPEGKAEEE